MNVIQHHDPLFRVIPRPFFLIFIIAITLQFTPLLTTAEGAKPFFTNRTVKVRLQPDKSDKPVGRLFVASPLRVLDRKPGWLRISLKGWYQEGAKRVLYALPGKRIFTLVLGRSAAAEPRDLTSQTDGDTGLTWTEAVFEGWIQDQAITDDLDSIWSAAWDLFATRCTVCHQRRIPDKYTANQWGALLKVMGPRTGLPKDDQQLILKYLQHHARDTIDNQASN